MEKKKSSSSVILELKELVDHINNTIPDVPGKQRLVRMCQKETTHFESLPSDLADDSAACSNLPYFKAITTIANSYGNRLVDLLCRYRLPLESTVNSSIHVHQFGDDDDDNHNNVVSSLNAIHSNSNDYLLRCDKQDSLLIDLICTQSDEGIDDFSRSRTCYGNADEASLWAPALWIKVVTRDSSRLNNAWRGEASSKHVACLGRQAEELVLASHWYQRGQPKYWIRVIVHWLPHGSFCAEINDIDSDLREYLQNIDVTLLTGSNPWINNCDIPTIIFKSPNYTVSLKNLILPVYKFKKFLNSFTEYDNTSGDFKQFKFEAIEKILSLLNRLSKTVNHEEQKASILTDEMLLFEVDDSLNSFKITYPMDAVLQKCALWPFLIDSYSRVDEVNRINLDVSALIAFVSELSQFNPTYSPTDRLISIDNNDNHDEAVSDKILECLQSVERRTQLLLNHPPLKPEKFEWLIKSEAEVPVLLSMNKYLRGKVPVVCLSAVHSFLNILALISGLSEWKRGIRLISHLVILPDLNSSGEIISPFSKTRESKNSNYLLTQRIMEVGNVLEALTITSNAGFLRSVRKSNLRYSALLLPARALTETTPRNVGSSS
ncbi:unnamed protein product [Schistosoma margrebowiei]|uniref:GATOR complex protein NPRL3 n=1 Tax=Schistosoma margrebowiei TaxID=48269 RepID=A0AA85AMY1_9TREM|nr:unnamed protein product [Schistosoma margrebowiei]